MVKRVVRFRAIVNPSRPDDAAEAEFILRGLPRLLSATQGLIQFCYMSRHPTGGPSEKDAVWLVCKPRRGKCRELEEAGRSALSKAVADGLAYDYRVEQDTDEGALAEWNKGVTGVPRFVSYEACWRYLDAATKVALEMLGAGSVVSTPGRPDIAVRMGPSQHIAAAHHLAHFLWNTLGLREAIGPSL